MRETLAVMDESHLGRADDAATRCGLGFVGRAGVPRRVPRPSPLGRVGSGDCLIGRSTSSILIDMATTHRKYRRIYDTPGDPHFVTFSCYQRQRLLSKDRTRQFVVEAIAKARSQSPFDLWAYVIMPEHVHMVILPADGSQMASILKSVKQSVSRRAMAWLRENSPQFLSRLEESKNGQIGYRFWQRGGGYDRNLRSVRDIHEKIIYTHENPVRRGLVTDGALWKWSSAMAWESGTDLPLEVQQETVPGLIESEGRLSLRQWS